MVANQERMAIDPKEMAREAEEAEDAEKEATEEVKEIGEETEEIEVTEVVIETGEVIEEDRIPPSPETRMETMTSRS